MRRKWLFPAISPTATFGKNITGTPHRKQIIQPLARRAGMVIHVHMDQARGEISDIPADQRGRQAEPARIAKRAAKVKCQRNQEQCKDYPLQQQLVSVQGSKNPCSPRLQMTPPDSCFAPDSAQLGHCGIRRGHSFACIIGVFIPLRSLSRAGLSSHKPLRHGCQPLFPSCPAAKAQRFPDHG